MYLRKPYVMEARHDPATLLPGAKSVIVLGIRYLLPEISQSGEDQKLGRVAAYATFPDYHQTVKEKARLLIADVSQIAQREINAKVYVDSGPVMEKDMAFSAGLAWIGKNTLAIHPNHGSAFLICCILTDLEIPTSNEHVPDLCGDCQKCISACPTSCIQGYTLDIPRCISYLTIEHKGVVPRDVREKIGIRVFGCDVCQEVCPINKQAVTPTEGYFFGLHPAIAINMDLAEELALNPQTFAQKYEGTVIMRTGFERHLRNAAIAAGNSSEPELIPLLEELIGLNSEFVSIHAVWALGQYNRTDTDTFLRNLLNAGVSSRLKEEILWVLQASN